MKHKQQLAEALAVTVRTIERDLQAGMPARKRREAIAAWADRIRAWKREGRRRPGPKPPPSTDRKTAAEIRHREARAELAEIQLAKAKGELHSRTECEANVVRCFAAVRTALAQAPDVLARRLYQAPSPDAIKLVVEEELRRCLEVLTTDESAAVDPGDARGDALAEADG